jgi:HD-like signal output (HDOD) protein
VARRPTSNERAPEAAFDRASDTALVHTAPRTDSMSEPATPPARLTVAPTTVEAWAACFDVATLPLLDDTAGDLEELRTQEDRVDAHLLGEVLTGDPLMTLKLLAHAGEVAARHRRREGSDAETVTEALVLLGIGPFFRDFGPQSTVGQWLGDWPEARAGFDRVLRRARRAARFAIGFAVHRMDHDAPVILEAALLHDFAELLLWLRAPALALRMQALQQADPTLRSAAAQRAVLHVTLAEVQQALMQRWRLPALLVHITADHARPHGWRDSAQLRTVQLAIRVARHSAGSWDNPALPDDVRDVADLLHMGEEPVRRLLLDIDAD